MCDVRRLCVLSAAFRLLSPGFCILASIHRPCASHANSQQPTIKTPSQATAIARNTIMTLTYGRRERTRSATDTRGAPLRTASGHGVMSVCVPNVNLGPQPPRRRAKDGRTRTNSGINGSDGDRTGTLFLSRGGFSRLRELCPLMGSCVAVAGRTLTSTPTVRRPPWA